jgi:hypothetical protein
VRNGSAFGFFELPGDRGSRIRCQNGFEFGFGQRRARTIQTKSAFNTVLSSDLAGGQRQSDLDQTESELTKFVSSDLDQTKSKFAKFASSDLAAKPASDIAVDVLEREARLQL